jgi:DNA-3-methyladenine glycosylase I
VIEPHTARCWWAEGDALLRAYHDEEWGRPLHDDRGLFELLSLESFQAGLSWLTILRKREAFRSAFAGWDPRLVAAFDDGDRARLLADSGIVRHAGKIDAAINNAGRLLELVEREGSFDAYLRKRVEPRGPLPPNAAASDLPSRTAASVLLSRDLQRHGFRFVAPTTVYSFMQAVGLVDDHLPGCFRYCATQANAPA